MTQQLAQDPEVFTQNMRMTFGGVGAPARTAPLPRSQSSNPSPNRVAVASASPPAPAVESAVMRARAAYEELRGFDLEQRARGIAAVRDASLITAESVARLAHDETRLGRYGDKVVMTQTAAERTPGIELLKSEFTGVGTSVSRTRLAPFGVIASVLPMTVPNEAVVSHTISMVAGGNSVVFMSHPAAAETTREAVRICSTALARAGLPADAVVMVDASGSEAAVALMRHPDIDLLVVTGGGAVVAEAMKVPVKAICAGPGNTPVVVDGTGSLRSAAECIVLGSSFDNTVGCVQEKEVFVPRAYSDDLVDAMTVHGAYLVSPAELDKLTELLLTDPKPGVASGVNRDFVGQDASKILGAIGIHAPEARSVIALVDEDHPFIWSEMLMPVLGICQTSSASHALELALRAEGGNRHSAVIHSRDSEFMAIAERELDVTVLVRNSPSFASVGVGSAQPFTVTLASRSGEGPTTARNFVRHHHVIDSITDGLAGV